MRYGNGVPAPSRSRRRTLQRVVGGALTLLGAVVVIGLFTVVFSEDPALAAVGVDLGLAFATVISALSQIAFLIGLWLLWSARPGSKRP